MMVGLYSFGGFSTVIENLSTELCRRGVKVTIGAMLFKRFPSEGPYNTKTILLNDKLRSGRSFEDFDIIHNHHAITNYFALITNSPFIFHYHGTPRSGKGNLYRLSLLSSVKVAGNHFAATITVSKTGYWDLKHYFKLGNVNVIHNGVDTDLFKPGLEGSVRKGIPQYLFVGYLYNHKRVEELILATKRLTKTYPKVHLQIVGSGYSYGKLRMLVHKLGVQAHIGFTGHVPYKLLPKYYSSCDVYVTASRNELFPLPLLESWACGIPVVASAIPAHLELIRKSGAGISYEPGDITQLVEKMKYAYEHGSQYVDHALQFAQDNDWAGIADKVLKVYAKLR